MDNNVIDFDKSKEKLINKRYPNISSLYSKGNELVFAESNLAFKKFQEVFFKYQDYLSDKSNKEVKLDEVLLYFGRYFDAIYKDVVVFDDKKVGKFKEALDYSMLSSGKRLRPFLMFVTYNLFLGTDFFMIAPFMVSIELIHTFSLIHDDLPCMDNDELRRGKPTVWKKYGEDIAVLVGDALMMEAATILVETILEVVYTSYGALTATSAIVLMKLAGLEGMITGQAFDVMNTNNTELKVEDIWYMYDKKTSALLAASIIIGANMSGRIGMNVEKIERMGHYIGEAYQIKDDLLEIESTEEKIGKSTKSDEKNNKVTYVSKVGVEKAKKRLSVLSNAISELADSFATVNNAKELLVFKSVLRYLLEREN